VPVIVVGNLSVGGTGKTPLVAWLSGYLRSKGWQPGIVTRGYGGIGAKWPQQVRADSDPVVVGEEAVLLARRCKVPIAVGPDRVAAVEALLKYHQCNIVLSDDGLQHYALARDIEIGVLDGVRRFGNGRLLPAGPLREPVSRLADTDAVVTYGVAARGEFPMRYSGNILVSVADENRRIGIDEFSEREVHAVTGIGDPDRFFTSLRGYGFTLKRHAFSDHHPFRRHDILFDDDLPVIMTEKDAIKCERFADKRHWYLPVKVQMTEVFGSRMTSLLSRLNNG
jgi:tetraacyldisaccharide 4'-kinase